MTKEQETIYEGMNIYQRLHAVMQEVDYVQKQKAKADGLKYNYVSHDAVTAKVREPLVKWGVIYYPQEMTTAQDGNRTTVTLKLRFVNIDKPEEYIETPSFGYGIDNQDKGPGKAISYAVKYALLKSFGLETGDDPENDNIDHINGGQKKAAQTVQEAMTPEWPEGHPCTKEQATALFTEASEALSMVHDEDELKSWVDQYGKKTKSWLTTYQINALGKKYSAAEGSIKNKSQLNGRA